ncbi:uncharacterized protein I303_108579 [Kwoniella dejecticola CBS 10117]|uniref:Endoplasmic reticulum transmembrane protein n=1 Tax=Kwoniella dejecticola CBS 10117 TaxID=1296121 RepID=A0A1A5ZX04_9TREE|nr:uncharacterized protein I303_07095 [Kwoniella dejecticola CBS 10117]OBR82336.1 hypothetical protein I303_07095 [Kwoniella dejecticola CBS 10117]
MDFLASSVDIAFLLLTLLIIYKQPILTSTSTADQEGQANGTIPPPQVSTSESLDSPLPSPGYLSVPSITVTPSSLPKSRTSAQKLPLPGAGGAQGRHKKKAVSFSLSSMDDIMPDKNSLGLKKFRPPTPFFTSPKSPNPTANLEMSPLPSPLASPNRKSSPIPSPTIKIDGAAREKELGMNEELERGQLDHGILQEDSMGIQKKWLVAGAR